MKAIVLAAGCSRRMGQQKQMLIWQGKTLLQHSIDKLDKADFEVITVLGSNADKIQQSISNSQVVINENWVEGMGNSIALAMKKLDKNDSAVMITQVDQLALTTQDYLLLKFHALRSPQKIICSRFNGVVKNDIHGFGMEKIMGVPTIFPAQYFSELMKLKQNMGAKKIIQQALNEDEKDKMSHRVDAVPLQNAAININTPAQWHNWQQNQYEHQNEQIFSENFSMMQ